MTQQPTQTLESLLSSVKRLLPGIRLDGTAKQAVQAIRDYTAILEINIPDAQLMSLESDDAMVSKRLGIALFLLSTARKIGLEIYAEHLSVQEPENDGEEEESESDWKARMIAHDVGAMAYQAQKRGDQVSLVILSDLLAPDSQGKGDRE